MKEKDLIKLKERIDAAKKEGSQLDGQLDFILTQLKDQFGVSSISSAERRLTKLEADLEKKRKERDDAIAEIEDKYEEA